MNAPLADLPTGLAAIVAALAAALPGGVNVVRAGGPFDVAEVRRHAMNAPAVVVACLGLTNYTRRGETWSVMGQLAAYVVTHDQSGAALRDVAALGLVDQLLRVVARNTWGLPEGFGVPDPASVEAANLYSGDLDSVAVALWALTWRQEFRVQSS
ncbi:phage protein Gp37 [Candidatus Thiodictyon syntrophicum]|uniref:Uncharacterized protein n=1 Tax=Candidatus Thiodictyon syntrophicum TaxID=1166950 RepID=A0A2K8U790_9GAMM|nr:hypothetical protein [Candidatus Thiodictyon syntrophicum]AUB81452.1 hypothetical protein THSYN_11135 [Candidatus Thiodictyon syntrophicum]